VAQVSNTEVLESAVLDVRPGEEAAFEASFSEAQSIIAASPGYLSHTLLRCMESKSRYLLLVWWRDLASHTEGFRGSPAYARWKALLHHYYDPFPTVEHYQPLGRPPRGDD
jgi:heme-degrading monooxygenase HmoA